MRYKGLVRVIASCAALSMAVSACTGSSHKDTHTSASSGSVSPASVSSSSPPSSIGAGVQLSGPALPTHATATVIPTVKTTVKDNLSALSPTYRLSPSGPLPSPTKVTLPLTTAAQAGEIVFVGTEETAAGPWSYLPATLSADRKSATFTTTHFSFFSVVGMILKGTLKTFESIFTATVADSLKTTGAKQPNCTDQSQARSGGYSISSTTKTNTVYWCFGESSGKRVLTVVNNRRYPLQLTHGSDYTVESEDPAAGDELASLSKFDVNKDQNILAPGDSITYVLDVAAGTYSEVQTTFDGPGNALYQLQVGVETALTFLTADGIVKEGSSAEQAVKEAKMVAQALKDTHCVSAIDKRDIAHVVPACLDAAGVFDGIGAVGVIISALSTVTSLINFFHSSFNSIWDNVTGHDDYTIKVSHASTELPFVGQWYVHDGQLTINSLEAGTIKEYLGFGSCPSLPTSATCNEIDSVRFVPGVGGTTLTGTITSIRYTDAGTGQPTSDPDLPDDFRVGTTFHLSFVRPHLLISKFTKYGLKDGNPYWCQAGLPTKYQTVCGA